MIESAMPAAATIQLKSAGEGIRVKIWDVWDEGAGLELPLDLDLPPEFSLLFDGPRIVADVKVKLQTGRLVRVAFVGAPRPAY